MIAKVNQRVNLLNLALFAIIILIHGKIMEYQEKITVNDLVEGIRFLGNSISNGDNIHAYSKSPIHIMVHNEILKFSKEELEQCKTKTVLGNSLWDISFRIHNPYILSAFLKKGAFVDKLSNGSKWLINSMEKPSKDIYQVIYYMEETKFGFHDKEEKQLHYWILRYLNKLDNPDHLEVVDKYLQDFGQKDSSKILNFIVRNPLNNGKDYDFYSYVVSKLKMQGIDISKNNLLNEYLPENDRFAKKKQDFFISSIHHSDLENLLQMGFRFNEQKYSFNGDNLFITLVKSKNKELINIIVPYLTNIKPKKGTIEDQHKVVEYFDNSVSSSFNWVKKQYDCLVLDSQLVVNQENITKKKLKI
jgi:hypothetical protein